MQDKDKPESQNIDPQRRWLLGAAGASVGCES